MSQLRIRLARIHQSERGLAFLLVAAIYVGLNEGPANWQSLRTCAAYLLFAVTLLRARVPEPAAPVRPMIASAHIQPES
jgi:hypothetical protein